MGSRCGTTSSCRWASVGVGSGSAGRSPPPSGDHVSPAAANGWHYGYNWWISPDGDAFTAAGHGGQFAMWFPEEHLVAVQVALPDAGLHGNEPGVFYDLVRTLW